MANNIDYIYLGALVKKVQEGDQNAFAELYGITSQKQYNYAYYYLKDSYLAQDAVQDVYIHVLKNIHTLKDPNLFQAWLNQITFHRCFDICKKKDKHYGEINPLALELTEDLVTEHNPEAKTEKNDEISRLHRAINKLPPTEQQVIVLKFFNDMTLDEIVLATGYSRSSVKRYLTSGKEHIAQWMNEGPAE